MLPALQRQMMEKVSFTVYKALIESNLVAKQQLRYLSGDELIFEIQEKVGF
jgi:hypothetical protein